MNSYGTELILDIHNCNVTLFTRSGIEKYLKELCNLIEMEREDLHFWDYENEPEEYEIAADHLKGISCVQFIKTSNITIHSLDILKKIFINIFSCKDFDVNIVSNHSVEYFGGTIANIKRISRL